ncbi:ATP-binding protein [Hungatella hominis]|uniref:ATP-binding protein n=1 Tax=Hungatella hominis TaxID=2763050 RepID=A0ABR7H3J6_9FIRM|nr:ATP-binding protein [Hungatella hominis]MBC5707758.1 ATP-binding protein [Hungatella hominis]
MINRELYMSRIRPFIGLDIIKVLTGLRRSGKSVMLELIKEELLRQGVTSAQFLSFNFEDMNNIPYCTAEALHDEIKKRVSAVDGKSYLFFDEIQEVRDWERCINSLRIELECDIYITGSNAKLLSGELATYLAGRYVEFVIYPFSYREFLMLYREIYPEATEQKVFSSYLTLGGMPYLSNLRFEAEPCRQYLTDIYNSVVLKDVVKRNNIRDIDMLERIIAYISANVGNTFSANAISKYLKSEYRTVSTETILNYIKACEEAFLLYRVRRQDLQGKKILTVNEKYYLADHGIREAIFGENLKDINLILENIVYMELLRRGYQVTVGKSGEREVDFIGTRQKEKLYIQVSYLLASDDTISREFGVYDLIRDNYPKYVVSMDEFDFGRNGIKHKNIREFLLMAEWN